MPNHGDILHRIARDETDDIDGYEDDQRAERKGGGHAQRL